MHTTTADCPIGIFDSGLGGLTIARAIQQALPHEHFIYYGDTLNFPFGEQSVELIQRYCLQITRFLLNRRCKIIVIACNSASVAAIDILQREFSERVLFVNIVEPVIAYLAQLPATKPIGMIGTTQTIQSNFYQKKLAIAQANIQLHALATPLLAPAIEENLSSPHIDTLLHDYLSQPELTNIASLLLACTHYPLVYQKFLTYYQGRNVEVIDPSTLVAKFTTALLTRRELLNSATTLGPHEYYVSHLSEKFKNHIELLFDGNQPFHELPLTVASYA